MTNSRIPCLVILLVVAIPLVYVPDGYNGWTEYYGNPVFDPKAYYQTVTAAGLDLTGVNNFAILATTYTAGAGTTLNGDLGYTTLGGTPTVSGITFNSTNPTYNSAKVIQANLIRSANDPTISGDCTTSITPATVLDSLTQPLLPGVYCITGAVSINERITLSGDGIYIFRIGGALNSVASSTVTLAGGATANNVFWVPAGAITLGASSVFAGNVLSDAAISVGATVNMTGRIVSNGAVTTGATVTITAPIISPRAPTVETPVQTSSGGTMTLPFTAPADNGGATITSYTVGYRTPTGSGAFTTVTGFSTSSPITVTGLSASTSYDFKIAAVNSAGTGTFTGITSGTTGPLVTSISSTNSNGTYSTSSVLSITVTFSEPVTVTGSPKITLATTPNHDATFLSGNGTSTLTFKYTVIAGDTSSRLDYVSTSSLALNGGTIKNADTINAVLTLPSPGTTNSLGANKYNVVDTRSSQTLVTNTFSIQTGSSLPSTISYSSIAPSLKIDSSVLTGGTSVGNSYTIPSSLQMINSNPDGGQVLLTYQESTRFSRTDLGVFDGNLAMPQDLGIQCGTINPTIGTLVSCIHVGSSSPLTLTIPARLQLDNQGANIPWFSVGGVTTQITNTCTSDSVAGFVANECSIVVGSNMIIWTNHFTNFGTTSLSSSSSSSTGDSTSSPSFDFSSFTLSTGFGGVLSDDITTFEVRKKSDISMGFKMPGGIGELNHIGLYVNIEKGQGKYDSDTYIYFDKYKTPQITIHDPHGFFKSVNIDVTEPSKSNLDVIYTFDFVKSLDKSSVIFEAWDNYRQSALKEIPYLLKVDDPTKPDTPSETIQPTTQEKPPVPDWLKSNAAWWAKGNIDDEEFTNGIGYLIQKQIIDIPELLQKNVSPEKIESDGTLIEPPEEFTPVVPDWVKNTALWWSEGKLTDDDFLVGIKYLLEKGIILVKV